MDLRRDPIPPLIRRLALPASVGMVFSTLLTVVDTWYAGMLSPTALAALSLAGPIFFLIMTLGIGAGQASNALVGNSLGADDETGARRLAIQAIVFATGLSLAAAFVGYLGTPALFRLMGGEDPYLEPATAYMNVVLLGSAFFALSIVINSILNTRGDTYSYRNAQIVAFFANIGLDPFFMFTLDMGVVGVAVATILLQGGVVAYLLYKVWRLDFMLNPAPAEFLPHWPSYVSLLRQSVPTIISMMLVALGSVIIVAFVTRFGEAAMAAYSIALRIEQLILLPVIGLNIAALSLTGVNYGAGLSDRIRSTYHWSIGYALVMVVSGGLLLLLFAPHLMAWFSDDIEVQEIGVTYLYYEAFILPAYSLTFLSSVILQGLKRPLIAMYFNIGRQLVGQILLFWLAVEVIGTDITGIWASVLILNWVLGIGIVWIVWRLLQQLDEELSVVASADSMALQP